MGRRLSIHDTSLDGFLSEGPGNGNAVVPVLDEVVIAYLDQLNRWQGNASVELEIEDVRPCE